MQNLLKSSLSASALYAQPANNECTGATDISALFDGNTNTSTLFDNTGATNEASDPPLSNGAACFFEDAINNTIWFSFVGDGNSYRITTVECTATNYVTNGDTQMALYTGSCAGLTAVPNGCNEDGPGAAPGNFFSEVTLDTEAGTTYYVMVDGFADANGPATGEFCLEVGPPTGPITDCEAGTLLTTGVVQVMGPNETFTIEVDGEIVPNSPTQGQFAWYFDNTNTNGSGGLGGAFWLNVGSGAEAMYNRDLNGILSSNGFPIMAGTWEVSGRVWSNAATTTTTDPCSITSEVLTVLFDEAPIVTDCEAGTLTTTGTVMVDDMNPTFTITSVDRIIPNSPTQGGYTWFFYPGVDGTGALGGAFSFGIIASESSTYDDDLNGVLSGNGFAPFGGTWHVRGQTSTDGTDINTAAATVCDMTVDSLTIVFPALDPGPCDAGMFVSTETQIVCPGDQAGVALVAGTDSIPLGGALGWLFDNSVSGGTGGVPGGTLLTNGSTPSAWDNDLNGILSGNGFAPLEGAFVLRSVMYTNPADPGGSICSVSADSILLLFGDVVDLEIIEDGSDLTAFVGPNFMDYTYAWSTGEMVMTITPPGPDTYSVTATDGLGCETVAEIVYMPTSTNEADIVNSLSVAPNPTSGLINVALDLPASKEVQLSVIDITGKEVMNLAPVTFSSRNFEVDLQAQAEGLYLLRFRIGDDVVTRRVVKN